MQIITLYTEIKNKKPFTVVTKIIENLGIKQGYTKLPMEKDVNIYKAHSDYLYKEKLSSLNKPQIYLPIQCTPGLVRIMTLQRCLCSNPQDLWICHLTRQKGFADKFKVISLEDYPGLYRWADVITGSLRSGGSSPAVVRGKCDNGSWVREITVLQAVKMKKGNHELRNVGVLGELGKTKKQFLL